MSNRLSTHTDVSTTIKRECRTARLLSNESLADEAFATCHAMEKISLEAGEGMDKIRWFLILRTEILRRMGGKSGRPEKSPRALLGAAGAN